MCCIGKAPNKYSINKKAWAVIHNRCAAMKADILGAWDWLGNTNSFWNTEYAVVGQYHSLVKFNIFREFQGDWYVELKHYYHYTHTHTHVTSSLRYFNVLYLGLTLEESMESSSREGSPLLSSVSLWLRKLSWSAEAAEISPRWLPSMEQPPQGYPPGSINGNI